LRIYRLRTMIHTSEKSDTPTTLQLSLMTRTRKVARSSGSLLNHRSRQRGLRGSPRFFSCCPDSLILPSLHKLLMNRGWAPSARWKAFDYLSRILQTCNVALYVLCVQFVFLVWQIVFSASLFAIRSSIFVSRVLLRKLSLSRMIHTIGRELCPHMKTLAPNRIHSWLRDQTGSPSHRVAVWFSCVRVHEPSILNYIMSRPRRLGREKCRYFGCGVIMENQGRLRST
jgi:hypothetical protein